VFVHLVTQRLELSHYWSAVRDLLTEATSSRDRTSARQLMCLALGLGSFEHSRASAVQLGMLQLVMKHLKASRQHCWLADPIMTDKDEQTAKELGFVTSRQADRLFERLADIHSTWRHSSSVVLLFMPHCEKFLYGRVLFYWLYLQLDGETDAACSPSLPYTTSAIQRALLPIVLLGNALTRYRDSRNNAIPRPAEQPATLLRRSRNQFAALCESPEHSMSPKEGSRQSGPQRGGCVRCPALSDEDAERVVDEVVSRVTLREAAMPGEYNECPVAFNDTVITTFGG